MENQTKNSVASDIKIRFDADEPIHKAALNVFYMMTEFIQVPIECQPIFNCTKLLREFLTPEMPFENDHKLAQKSLDFPLPLMVYTSIEGRRKLECGETAILKALVEGTKLAIDEHQLNTRWLPFGKKIRDVMTKMNEFVYDEFLENKTHDVVMLTDHRVQDELDEILDTLEVRLLQSGNDFLTGNTLTIADLVVICELFPTFGKIEKSCRDLRIKYTNVLCWLKRMDGIYSIGYVLRQSVDLYPNEEHRPARLYAPLLPLKSTKPRDDYLNF